ncbi:Rrf2 family transcriptional regulator [Listeria seeligeri]|uniref:Rrf2 family transcriptional regulator n=2 Tax=Listeria seeligeri TaxID=1640 RepID=A0ABR5E551_LISSE|nr:Rrf2 family transcriptional regulator [Listeria seeligeri]EFS01056.1 putative transcriptional regulator [Listeria seeligeri FSL N1-067]KKD44838.1 Rrf2 family transcriptional regulator [Listeria seeligeri]MBC1578275.1 Rrf2 family transcriptional regulator [Listeria seeligeri]MBC1916188.1 Rrf2 family transcriptional regulator [Listeria seeligeri]MBC1989767.1 Rrf2 family transcriptional regulator [Listeria seeligeri]
MKYSKATNYALHTMVYLANLSAEKSVGVKELASKQNVSPTYLSKVLTMLVKADFVESITGVNGGYKLAKPATNISFLDVIQAIEGKTAFFHCDPKNHAETKSHCLIGEVMGNAVQQMEDYLSKQTIGSIVVEIEKHHH